jgi:hypothetical protein
MSILAVVLASVLTSVVTALAFLALIALLGRRAIAAPAAALAAVAVPTPTPVAAPAAPAAPATPPRAAPREPSNLFSVHRARLTFLDSPVRAGQPCRVRFEWLLFNGAGSVITYRSRMRAQKGLGELFPELIAPEGSAPRAASSEERIVGVLEAVYVWPNPGLFEVRARLKAAILNSPFTYQFEVKRKVRVKVGDGA